VLRHVRAGGSARSISIGRRTRKALGIETSGFRYVTRLRPLTPPRARSTCPRLLRCAQSP
jgi:hypothetical protein